MKKFTILKAAFLSAILFILFSMVSFSQTCKLFEDFENEGWASTNYNERTVTDDIGTWTVKAVGTMDGSDRYNGTRSLRLRGNSGDNCFVQMNFDKQNGIGEVSFYYASYSTHSGGIIVLYYSTNGGTNWINGGSVTAPAWGSGMLEAIFPINIQGNVRIKIVREGSLANFTSVNVDDICLTDYNPAGYVSAPTFDPSGGNYSAPVNVTISSDTEGAIIRYTLDGNDPTESSTQYTIPVNIATQTTLKAKAWKEGMVESSVATATYNFPQGVSTLAELRSLAPVYNAGSNVGTTVYTYTGQAIVTQKKTSTATNQAITMYIQDETAATMVYDVPGMLKDLEIGDKVTNISGTLTNYYGMIEMIPTAPINYDILAMDQQVPTTVITAAQLDNNHNSTIQAKIVTIKGVIYKQTGVFEKNKYYGLIENSIEYDSVVYVEQLFDTEYIGKPIPIIAVNINGVINFKGGTGIETRNRIVPLDNDKIIKNISSFNKSVIKLSPNPANSFVNIITGSPMRLELYSILGNLIATDYLYEGTNTISVSNYPAGLYLMKLIDKNTGETYVQKLVVQ